MNKKIKNWKKIYLFFLFSIISPSLFAQHAMAEEDEYVYKPSFFTPKQLKNEGGWQLHPEEKGALVRRDTNLWKHVHESLYAPGNNLSNVSFGYIYTTRDSSDGVHWLRDRIEKIYNYTRGGCLYKIALSDYAVSVKDVYPGIEGLKDSNEVAFMRKIDWTQVVGWWIMDKNGRFIDQFIRNPDYSPIRYSSLGRSSDLKITHAPYWLAAFPESDNCPDPDDNKWGLSPWKEYTVELPTDIPDKKRIYPRKSAYKAATDFYSGAKIHSSRVNYQPSSG